MTDTPEKKVNAGRQRSINKIVAALLALARETQYNSITVTELCSRAGVARKTFYRNFDSKDAVVEYRFDVMFGDLTSKYDFVDAGSSAMITYCFDYLARERDFAALFLDDGLYSLIIRKIVRYIEIAYDDTLYSAASFEPMFAEYYHKFIAVGLMSIIHTWIRGDCKQPIKTMVALTVRLLSGVIE